MSERDAAAVRFPPPFVYLLAVALGVLLQWLVHPIGLGLALPVRAGGALVAIGLGVACVLAAFGLFRRIGQDPAPWTPTPEIVTTGIYRVTRNPMYVGMGLIQLGLGVALANGWIVALVLPALAIVQAIAIRHEEAYLEQKFGEAYRAYKRSVRRWL